MFFTRKPHEIVKTFFLGELTIDVVQWEDGAHDVFITRPKRGRAVVVLCLCIEHAEDLGAVLQEAAAFAASRD